MSQVISETDALKNVRLFTLFKVFFSARFYYPVYALLFLDFGLTLEQFGILNALWAATIVVLEVPSGALADTVGRKFLLVAAGVFMIFEMGVLLFAPINGGFLLFALFVCNRILSGAAEAAASGADEALAYDSLKMAGIEDRWGSVLERVQRDTSLAFFFAMMVGAAVYDPEMVNAGLQFLGISTLVEQSQLVKLPIILTLISGVVVLLTTLRMKELPREGRRTALETLMTSWRQSLEASKWIWATATPFAIILAAMILDSTVRQFLTLGSEYWHAIKLPIASYGLIGSGMALLGLFVPRIARAMANRYKPVKNFILTSAVLFLGLFGLGFAVPYWGIIPAILLYGGMHLTGFFVSRYLNEVAPSEQRATILSFRGLSTNVSYGVVSILYSLLISGIRERGDTTMVVDGDDQQNEIFVESLEWFPWYFLISFVLVFIVYRLRFKGRTVDAGGVV